MLSVYDMLAEAALGNRNGKIKEVLRQAEPFAGGVATATEQVRSTRLRLVDHSRMESLATRFQAKLADTGGSGGVCDEAIHSLTRIRAARATSDALSGLFVVAYWVVV